MKKIIYSLMMLAFLAVGFTSCDEEKALPPMVLPEGQGTIESPFSVPAAIQQAKANGETSTDYFFTGGYVISGSIDTSYGNATWVISDKADGSGSTMTVYRAKDFNNQKFTDGEKVNVGDYIVVYAPIINFRGNTPETNGGYLYSINGEVGSEIAGGGNTGGSDSGEMKGDGSQSNPFNVAAAIKKAVDNGETSDVNYYTGGYVISGSIDTNYGNGTWVVADNKDGSGPTMTIYRAKDINNQKFTDENKVKVGDYIVVCAPIINFKGNTPETNLGYLYSINGNTGNANEGGNQGGGNDTPSDATPIPDGTGSLSAPYNAQQANALAASLAEGQESGEVYIEGYVNSVKEISAQYGNATFYLANIPGGGDTLYVYRIYGWNGEKVTDENMLKVGDRVVIKAVLMNYKGNTPETKQNTGGIISINGQTN